MKLSRAQILAHRRRIGNLDDRAPFGAGALHSAAWAGLQDSMPRAAVLSVNARVLDTPADVWADDTFVQVWGPRYSAYVVAAEDRAVFTVGRHPSTGVAVERAVNLADRIEEVLGGDTMTYSQVGKALGVSPNSLRYATTTGRVVIRWEGAGKPTIRSVPAPPVDVDDARDELVRRYLQVFGVGTEESFGAWAGVKQRDAHATFTRLASEVVAVQTPVGDGVVLASDIDGMRKPPGPPAAARLLPSGDTYYLLQGVDRELVVRQADRRSKLWTSRVWPGAVLVDGEIVGTWRRTRGVVTIEPWKRLMRTQKEAVAAEAEALPLPDVDRITIDWLN